MINTRETITLEMRIDALERAVEMLLLERESKSEEEKAILVQWDEQMEEHFSEYLNVLHRIEAIEAELIEQADIRRTAEEKKREQYVREQSYLSGLCANGAFAR